MIFDEEPINWQFGQTARIPQGEEAANISPFLGHLPEQSHIIGVVF